MNGSVDSGGAMKRRFDSLRSRLLLPFGHGFLIGFLVVAPLLFALALFLNQAPLHSIFASPVPVRHLKTGSALLALAPRIVRMNRSGQTLVCGSSEFYATERGSSVEEHLRALRSDAMDHIVVAPTDGSALTRVVFLLHRLSGTGVRPERIVIVLNPYYATRANRFYPSYLHGLYPDPESLLLDVRADRAGTFALPSVRPVVDSAVAPLHDRSDIALRIGAIRNLVYRRIAIPFHTKIALFQLPERGDSPTILHAPTPFPLSEAETWRVPTDFGATHAGEMVQQLVALIRTTGVRSATLVVLPVNRSYYRSLGLDPDRFNRLLNGAIEAITKKRGLKIVFVKELDLSDHYSDAVHLTDAGREILARRLLAEVFP